MNEHISKFIRMVVFVVIIGTIITVLNPTLKSDSQSVEDAMMKNMVRETKAANGMLQGVQSYVLNRSDSDSAAEAVPETAASKETTQEAGSVEEAGENADSEKDLSREIAVTMVETELESVYDIADTDAAAIMEAAEEYILIEETRESSQSYYFRLAEMDRQLSAKTKEAAKKNVSEQQTVADSVLKFWDDELNMIYQALRDIMSREEFSALREEERSWIRSRDAAATMAASANNSATNSVQNLSYTQSLIDWTKERVYELAEMYYGE